MFRHGRGPDREAGLRAGGGALLARRSGVSRVTRGGERADRASSAGDRASGSAALGYSLPSPAATASARRRARAGSALLEGERGRGRARARDALSQVDKRERWSVLRP